MKILNTAAAAGSISLGSMATYRRRVLDAVDPGAANTFVDLFSYTVPGTVEIAYLDIKMQGISSTSVFTGELVVDGVVLETFTYTSGGSNDSIRIFGNHADTVAASFAVDGRGFTVLSANRTVLFRGKSTGWGAGDSFQVSSLEITYDV